MNQLRTNFHKLIDSIDNENLLAKFYNIMSETKESMDGRLWNNLTDEERDELLLSETESENPVNLISFQEMKKKHQKWL